MAEVVFFHHVQGLTPGIVAFADELRAAGHTVHTPDLFEGQTFASIEDGIAYVRSQPEGALDERADKAVASLPSEVVLGGTSFGAGQAQRLASTSTAAGILLESFVGPEWIQPWPEGVPAQVHGMDADPFFAEEGDLEAARAVASTRSDIEVFTYPGNVHLFTDSSLAAYDADATGVVTSRVLELLAGL